MAVVHCKQIGFRDLSQDILERKRYQTTYQVLTSDPTDGAGVVLAFAGLPAYGAWFEVLNALGAVSDLDVDAYLTSKKATQSDPDNFQNWTVTCEYVGRGDPTLEPAKVTIGRVKYQEAMQVDALNQFVVNTAGDPYESGVLRDRSRRTITITKNVLTCDPVGDDDFTDTVNAFTFLASRFAPGWAPGTCKIDDISYEAVWLEDLSDIHYYVRTVKIEAKKDGWTVKKISAGFQFKPPAPVAGFERLPLILPGGIKPSTPQLLDEDGMPLAPGSDPFIQEFTPYEAVDWAPLALDF